MSGFWLQLGLQAAVLVTATHAADALPQPALLSDPAHDAFVYTAPIEPAYQPVLFETFALDFYLPPEPAPVYETYVDAYAPLPPDDYALLGAPQHDYHSDAFFFGN